jgi:hypothetical protein
MGVSVSPQNTPETCLVETLPHKNLIYRDLNIFPDRDHTCLRFYGDENSRTSFCEAASTPIYIPCKRRPKGSGSHGTTTWMHSCTHCWHMVFPILQHFECPL